jgi:hypothetical protein
LLPKLNALPLLLPALLLLLPLLPLLPLSAASAAGLPWSAPADPRMSLPAAAAVAGLRRPLTTSPPSPVLMAITLGLRGRLAAAAGVSNLQCSMRSGVPSSGAAGR